jgi:hypothetical protein
VLFNPLKKITECVQVCDSALRPSRPKPPKGGTAGAELTFPTEVAGYSYEGADSIHRMVHPFRPLLAHCIGRRGPFAAGLANISAIPFNRHCGERSICIDSRFVVFACATVGVEESLTGDRRTRIG